MEQKNNQKNGKAESLKSYAPHRQTPILLASDLRTSEFKKRASNLPSWLVKPVGEICVARLSDNDLYQKCREYGMNAKLWLRKFAGLLPEVAKRSLHRKKGFISIQEFAGKLAGMSEYAVDRILQLYSKIKDKPSLLKLFESGAQGWSKIDKVAYVATPETDKAWADKVTLLSTRALEMLVQNYRRDCVHVNEKENKRLFGQSRMDDAVGNLLLAEKFEPPVRFSFPASKDVEFDLRLAKQKLEKQSKQALSWNEAFQMLIQKSELVNVETGKFMGGGVIKKYTGLCLKCRKKARIQSVQICDECMNNNGRNASDGCNDGNGDKHRVAVRH